MGQATKGGHVAVQTEALERLVMADKWLRQAADALELVDVSRLTDAERIAYSRSCSLVAAAQSEPVRLMVTNAMATEALEEVEEEEEAA